MKYVKVMIEKYPKPKNKDSVYFSDKVNFDLGAKYQLCII